VTVHRARHGAFTGRALAEEPTARAAVERALREAQPPTWRRAAAAYPATPGRPYGCRVLHSAANCTAPEVEESLRARRDADIAAFESRTR
jgi:hypothetical protein